MTQLPPLIKGCCPEGKRRVLLTVSYDGTAYAGWQRQQNALAVQQVLEEALRKLTGEATLTVTGSSRTDAGVHALGQRVHFDTASRIPPDKFPFALNTCLPADIRVLEGRYVPAAFHARFDAAGAPLCFAGVDLLYEDYGPVVGEVEDVVGSRMLYRVSDLDVVGLYLDEIRRRI